MSSQVITIKVDATTKKQAQETAKQMGLSLSDVIKDHLKHFIQAKRVALNRPNEIPNAYFKRTLKKALKNRAEGKGSPVFRSGKEAVKWLEDQGI